MSTTLILAACGLSVLFFILWLTALRVEAVKTVLKILTVCFLLGISFFSIFGFLASFENVTNSRYWKASYAVVFIFSVVLSLKIIGVPKSLWTKSSIFSFQKTSWKHSWKYDESLLDTLKNDSFVPRLTHMYGLGECVGETAKHTFYRRRWP